MYDDFGFDDGFNDGMTVEADIVQALIENVPEDSTACLAWLHNAVLDAGEVFLDNCKTRIDPEDIGQYRECQTIWEELHQLGKTFPRNSMTDEEMDKAMIDASNALYSFMDEDVDDDFDSDKALDMDYLNPDDLQITFENLYAELFLMLADGEEVEPDNVPEWMDMRIAALDVSDDVKTECQRTIRDLAVYVSFGQITEEDLEDVEDLF